MSGGRVSIRGGRAWGPLSPKIGIKSLATFRVKNAPSLNCSDARLAHGRIRESLNYYRLAHGGKKRITEPQTRTQIIKAVTKVQKAARNVMRSDSKQTWLDRLDDALGQGTNLIADLHFVMRRQGIDIYNLRSKLMRKTFSNDDLMAVQALADVNIGDIVPERGHPDPPLTRLVAELSPVWQEITGTSPYPKNDLYVDKKCPFAEWLRDQIWKLGLNRPPKNSIPLIIKQQKKVKK